MSSVAALIFLGALILVGQQSLGAFLEPSPHAAKIAAE